MSQRGDIRMGSTLVDALKATGDPRLPFYSAPDGSGDYVGSAPGSENTLASTPGDYIAGIGASSVFISYAEQKFMEAECEIKADFELPDFNDNCNPTTIIIPENTDQNLNIKIYEKNKPDNFIEKNIFVDNTITHYLSNSDIYVQ